MAAIVAWCSRSPSPCGNEEILRQVLAAAFPRLCVLVHRGRARYGFGQVGWLSALMERCPYEAPEHQAPAWIAAGERRVAAAGDHAQDDRHHVDGAHHHQRRWHRLPPHVRAFRTVPPIEDARWADVTSLPRQLVLLIASGRSDGVRHEAMGDLLISITSRQGTEAVGASSPLEPA